MRLYMSWVPMFIELGSSFAHTGEGRVGLGLFALPRTYALTTMCLDGGSCCIEDMSRLPSFLFGRSWYLLLGCRWFRVVIHVSYGLSSLVCWSTFTLLKVNSCISSLGKDDFFLCRRVLIVIWYWFCSMDQVVTYYMCTIRVRTIICILIYFCFGLANR